MFAPHVYAVILAGGSGTRFWPKSRHLKPKQLCAIGRADKTMLEITLDRLEGLIPVERRIIVTHKDQVTLTKQIVKDKCRIILAEPDARNTANALALAALDVKAHHTGPRPAVMISLHADHVIQKEDAFRATLQQAVNTAEHNLLVLLGIVAKYPETGYGYIEQGQSLKLDQVKEAFKVASFREKPDAKTAQQYLDTGRFFWNCGIFVWKVDKIIEELKKFLPASVEGLQKLLTRPAMTFSDVTPEDLASAYQKLPKIAIDNAVLEVSDSVAMVKADIGWQDVGSWDALAQCFPTDAQGNLTYGDILMLDCKNTTVDTDGPMVATIGLNDMVVVAAGGAILVCPRSKAQDVKKVVEYLKEHQRKELL